VVRATGSLLRGPSRADESLQLWERYEGECDERWQAFVLYRDQPQNGEERSTRTVAEQLDKSRQLVGRWSASDGWSRRVAAYDRHIDAQKRMALANEMEATVRAEAQTLAASRVMISQSVQSVLKDIAAASEEGRDPFAGWDLREKVRTASVLVKALPAIVQAERLVAGLSTSKVGGQDGGATKAGAEQRAETMDRGELEAYLLGRDEHRTRPPDGRPPE